MPTPLFTLTGTITDFTGAADPNGTVVITLCNYLPQIPRVGNTSILDQVVVSPTVNASGQFSVTLYGNDVISPGPNVTFYSVQITSSSGNKFSNKYSFTGSGTFDLSNLTPLTGAITAPPGNVVNGPLTVTGNLSVGGTLLTGIPGVGATTFTLSQALASTTWTANHNLGTQSIVAMCYDNNFNQIIPDNLQNTGVNTTVAKFLQPQSGFMVCVNVGNWTPSVSSPNNIIGNPTSSQSINGNFPFTINGGSLNASRIENIRYADQFSGADIGAKINAAYADLPTKTVTDSYFDSFTAPYGTIVVPAGDYTFSTAIVINSPFVNIVGQGMTATQLFYTGSGTAVWFNPYTGAGSHPFTNVSEFASGNGLFDLAINGASSLSGAVGLRTTDFSGFRLNNVAIRNFSGTTSGTGFLAPTYVGSIGWLDDTAYLYNEKMHVSRLALENNTISWAISPASTSAGYPNTTFGYGVFDVAIMNHAGQRGFLMVNGDFSRSLIKMTVNQVDSPANATAIELEGAANWYANNYVIEIESPGVGGIGTGHEIKINSTQNVPFTGTGILIQGAMSSNITGLTQAGNTVYLPPQNGLWWPVFQTPGSTTGQNPMFRLDPNASNQTRQNVIDVTAQAPSGYQTNSWPTSSGSIPVINTSGFLNVSGVSGSPVVALLDTTPAQTTPNKYISSASGELHIVNSALSTNILRLTDAGQLTVTGAAVVGAATPTVGAGQLGIGTTDGFGNGTAGTAVTTTLKGTGSGPTTPQTIVDYLQINKGGTTYWLPLVQ